MIEPLPARLRREIPRLLTPGEQIEIQINGAFKEALICTNIKVAIIKGGLLTGQIFGTNVFQLPYRNIAGVEVNFHLLSGYFEVSAGGMQNKEKSFWSNARTTDPARAPNCVSLTRANVEKFRSACGYILEKIGEQTSLSAAHTKSNDLIDAIERLAQLRAGGVISDEEFSAKKAELLAKL